MDISRLGGVVAPRGVAYPAAFDLRSAGRVSAVKSQLTFGTCWAFATMAALESSLLPAQSLDLSEDNLILASGFDMGDDAYFHGGNLWMSTAYLARWAGPVLESDDPYGDHYAPAGLTAREHVQEVLFVPGGATPTDNDNIKWALMTYGAVATAIYWTDADYNASTASYFCAGGGQTNHAVTICGWDDAYPADDFTPRPQGDGAWLVKNSWGTGFGQGGYFWVSYYDENCAAADVQHAVFSSVQPSDNYSVQYSYDPLGQVDTYGIGLDSVWGANAFRAYSDRPIVALGFYTPVPGSSYTLYAGSSLDDLKADGSGTLTMPGFHTVPLTTPWPVTKGNAFVVAVRLKTPGDEYPLSIEFAMPGYSSAATAGPGQSFTKTDETTWTDLTDWNTTANVCLKAYAKSDVPTPTPTATPMPGPITVVAPMAVSVKKGRVASLPFRVNESVVGGLADVSILIKDRGGWVVSRKAVKDAPMNAPQRLRFTCTLARGSYTFYLSATTAAGGRSVNTASNTLTVR